MPWRTKNWIPSLYDFVMIPTDKSNQNLTSPQVERTLIKIHCGRYNRQQSFSFYLSRPTGDRLPWNFGAGRRRGTGDVARSPQRLWTSLKRISSRPLRGCSEGWHSDKSGGISRPETAEDTNDWALTWRESRDEIRSEDISEVADDVALGGSRRFGRFMFPGPFAFANSTRTFEPQSIFPSKASITSAASFVLTNSTNANPGGWWASHTSRSLPKRANSLSRSSLFADSDRSPMYSLFGIRLGVFFLGWNYSDIEDYKIQQSQVILPNTLYFYRQNKWCLLLESLLSEKYFISFP